MSPGALVLLNDILGGRLSQALSEPPSAVTTEVEHLATLAALRQARVRPALV